MALAASQSSATLGNVVASASGVGKSTIGAVGLAELHRAYRGRLHRFFARRGARQDADDLVQESFVRFAGMQAKCPEKVVDCPEAYLTTIAINLLRDRAVVAARRSTALHIPADDVVLVGSDAIAEQLSRLGLKYIALVPGSSYRGLHDSIVNYKGNASPEMLVCLHEVCFPAVPTPIALYANHM